MDNIPLFAWVEVPKVGPLPAFKAVFAGRGAEGWTSTGSFINITCLGWNRPFDSAQGPGNITHGPGNITQGPGNYLRRM